MDDISKMTDAELDAAVAVEVMGWSRLERRKTSDNMPTVWVDGYGSRVFTFSPSDNIAAAFDAMEAGRLRGIGFELEAHPRGWSAWSGMVLQFAGIPFEKLPRKLMECLLSAVRQQDERTSANAK